MTSRDFVYWLQGLFELAAPKVLDERQTDLVKRHLAMVFIHEIDPSMGGLEHQRRLTEAHGGKVIGWEPLTVCPQTVKRERRPLDRLEPETHGDEATPQLGQTELDRLAEEGRELARQMQRSGGFSGYTREPQINC